MIAADPSPPKPDVICFIDEAGDRGYLRNLTPHDDDKISVLCALPVPAEHLDDVRSVVSPLYREFVTAAPPGAKLHITDAFKPGNEAWAAVARDVRRRLFDFMLQRQIMVVYTARRFSIARGTYESQQTSKRSKAPSARHRYAVPGANRSSGEQVDDQVMIDLSLLIDAFMEIETRRLADFMFDDIDPSVADRYTRMIERTRRISYRRQDITVRNLDTQQNETRTVEMRANVDFRLDAAYLGSIAVAGKSEPLIFMADVVANALWRHLKTLPPDTPLNHGSALANWSLEPVTFYDRSLNFSLMDQL